MNKKELVKAVREGDLYERIVAEVKENDRFVVLGNEISRKDEDTFKVIRTVSMMHHHHDQLVAEGTIEYCAKIVRGDLKQKVYDGEII